MKRIILLVFSFFIFFSFNIFADEDLTGKNVLCSDLLWGFEFISSEEVKVINTNINNETNIRKYHYETDSKLPYINIYLMENKIRNLIYSVHRKTLRVDIWTMTSGGITTREMIPQGFCNNTDINDILAYIKKIKEYRN